MDSHKLVIKLFVQDASSLKQEEFIPILHSWIQTQAVADHLLIDVADYQHVPDGPGTVLVSHEANFYMDRGDGRLGLMYSRKQPAPGGFDDRLRQALRAALEACARLEQDPRLAGRIRFRTDEMLFRFNDRLLAPNTTQTFERIKASLSAVLGKIFGSDPQLEHRVDALRLFEVVAKFTNSPGLDELLRGLAQSGATAAPAR